MPVSAVKRLSAEQMAAVLAKLDEVMAEAARLRREITKQLVDQRRAQQQKISVRTNRR